MPAIRWQSLVLNEKGEDFTNMTKTLDQPAKTDVRNLCLGVGQKFQHGNCLADLDDGGAHGERHFRPRCNNPLRLATATGNTIDEIGIAK